MSVVRLDVDRRLDYMRTRGQSAYLTVGPFRFGVSTADGIAISFAIHVFGWAIGWGVEPPEYLT